MAEWNPTNGFESLQRELTRVIEESFRRTEPFMPTAFLPGRAARRYPLINLYEEPDALYVEALAPGIDPGSLNITVLRNVLTISGEKRRVPGAVQPESFHRSERATGKFVRNIELPAEINENAIQADYRNGLLFIRLPKTEKAKPKQIAVQVA